MTDDLSVEVFRRAVAQLGLPPEMCLYQLRPGGASEDLLSGTRNEAAIKVRGRWRSDSSVRRYSKPAQLRRLLGSTPEAKRSLARDAAKTLELVMTRRQRPLIF